MIDIAGGTLGYCERCRRRDAELGWQHLRCADQARVSLKMNGSHRTGTSLMYRTAGRAMIVLLPVLLASRYSK